MATEVIGIYDNNFNALFQEAKYIKASVSDTSMIFEHPLEDGSKIADYKVSNPIEIQLQIMLLGADYRNTYKAIKKIDTNATALTIQTRTDVYSNMYISSMPYEEDNTISDGIKIAISLKQALFENPNTVRTAIDPRYSKDSNTSRNGNVQGENVNDTKRQSILASLL